ETDQARRNEPDVAQRRVPPADVRWVEEDLAEGVVVGDRLDALAGVRDCHHELAGVLVSWRAPGSERLLGAIPGVGLEGEGLRRGAGLAGDDPERRERIEVVHRRGYGRRVGRVEDAEIEPVVRGPERLPQDLRREAAATHPAHDRGREPGLANG